MNRRCWLAAALIVVCGAALAGCAYPKAAEPPSALTAAEIESLKARFPEATDVSLSTGRDLFVKNCGDCHDHADVMLIDDGKWPDIIKDMGKEANLTGEQSDSVLKFILAVRAARRSVPVSK